MHAENEFNGDQQERERVEDRPQEDRVVDEMDIARRMARQPGAEGPRPSWQWDGNRTEPTFEPSINCSGCWHGYIRAGVCIDA